MPKLAQQGGSWFVASTILPHCFKQYMHDEAAVSKPLYFIQCSNLCFFLGWIDEKAYLQHCDSDMVILILVSLFHNQCWGRG